MNNIIVTLFCCFRGIFTFIKIYLKFFFDFRHHVGFLGFTLIYVELSLGYDPATVTLLDCKFTQYLSHRLVQFVPR